MIIIALYETPYAIAWYLGLPEALKESDIENRTSGFPCKSYFQAL